MSYFYCKRVERVNKLKKVLTKDENFQIVIHQFPFSIAKMFYIQKYELFKL